MEIFIPGGGNKNWFKTVSDCVTNVPSFAVASYDADSVFRFLRRCQSLAMEWMVFCYASTGLQTESNEQKSSLAIVVRLVVDRLTVFRGGSRYELAHSTSLYRETMLAYL
jgi:hypothetical protein